MRRLGMFPQEPDINLNGNACAGEIRLQSGSQATIAIVFANDVHPQSVHVEDKAIISDISVDDLANSTVNGSFGRLAYPEQIDIPCGPTRFTHTCREQHRPFQDELVAVLGLLESR